MAEIVSCPACERTLQVPESYFGQTVQCPECKHTFAAAPASAAPRAAPPAVPEAGRVPEWDKPPDKPRPRDDEEPAEDDLPEGASPDSLFGRYRRTAASFQFIGGGLTAPTVTVAAPATAARTFIATPPQVVWRKPIAD